MRKHILNVVVSAVVCLICAVAFGYGLGSVSDIVGDNLFDCDMFCTWLLFIIVGVYAKIDTTAWKVIKSRV